METPMVLRFNHFSMIVAEVSKFQHVACFVLLGNNPELPVVRQCSRISNCGVVSSGAVQTRGPLSDLIFTRSNS